MNNVTESLTISIAGLSPTILALAGGVVAVVVVVLVFLLVRNSNLRREQDEEAAIRAAEADARMAELLKIQAEMQGRISTMAEVFGTRQAELNQAIGQRLDGMSQRVSTTISEQTKSTHENLQRLQERLAVIDAAQNNIQTLAKDVVGLQAILSNKQTRGAFGQSRMETIVADGLPMGAYAFQQTLSNGSRPDCTVRMPNGAPPLRHRCQVSSRSLECHSRRGHGGRNQACLAAIPPRYGDPCPRYIGEVFYPG